MHSPGLWVEYCAMLQNQEFADFCVYKMQHSQFCALVSCVTYRIYYSIALKILLVICDCFIGIKLYSTSDTNFCSLPLSSISVAEMTD